MLTKLKILPVDEENIHFDRVHRITSRRSQSNGRSLQPRPIIVRLMEFQDKFFIKSFIKNLPRGTGFGISDDFPKEVDEVRKMLRRRQKKAPEEGCILQRRKADHRWCSVPWRRNITIFFLWAFNGQLS